jgi:hypothetical protein
METPLNTKTKQYFPHGQWIIGILGLMVASTFAFFAFKGTVLTGAPVNKLVNAAVESGVAPYICLYRSIHSPYGALPGAMGDGPWIDQYLLQESSNGMGDVGGAVKNALMDQAKIYGEKLGEGLGADAGGPFGAMVGKAAGGYLGPAVVNSIPGLNGALHSYAVFDSNGKRIAVLGSDPPSVSDAGEYIGRLRKYASQPPTEYQVWYRSNFPPRRIKLAFTDSWELVMQYWHQNIKPPGHNTWAWCLTTADNEIIYTVGWSTPTEKEMQAYR